MKAYVLWMIAAAITVGGCRKFVQVPDPDTSLGTAAVFSSDETATAALMGVYSRAMTLQGSFVNGGNTIYPALSADECTLTQVSSALEEFSKPCLENGNTAIAQLYGSAYNIIYNVNTLLENLPVSKRVSLAVRRQLTGEALFIRALIYSRLVVLWGAVPLITGTNADVNAIAPRTGADSIWQQVVNDVLGADNLLDTIYAWAGQGSVERTRPNRWAARALYARVSLQLGQWQTAEAAASAVIDSGGYCLEPSVDSVFLKGSREAIWQLQPVSTFMNSAEGYYFLPLDNPQAKPVFVLTPGLLAAFEAGDKRKTRWVGTKTAGGIVCAYPAKYKIRTGPPYREYNIALRLAEMYLIRAEARASLGQLTEATADLNTIRVRAGLAALTSGMTKDALIAAIIRERRVELFAEWGHRWVDLKRWGQADAVLSPLKTGWTSDAQLYPFPLTEVQRNPTLLQNAGY